MNIMDSEVVQVVELSFVVPNEPTPREGLWLSPLDLIIANRGHTPTVYLYSSSNVATADDLFDIARLKEAMAKALVDFYPLAGRLGVDDDGRAEITCNGEGALFVVARADFTVDDIKDGFKPSPELRRLFVPRIEPASVILAIQVTFLKCGGVVLGTALHHAAIDASSAFHFFQTWSAISKHGDRATVELPFHDRTLLHARSPPTVHPDALSRFYPKLTFSDPSGPLAFEVFAISKDQVASLKSLCGGTSTFCAMSALVWQCALIARRLPPDSETCLTFPANARRRVRPPLPNRYFGNALVRLGVTGAVRDIASEALASVAGRIKDAIDRMDDELVRSAADYCEMAEMDSQPVKGMHLARDGPADYQLARHANVRCRFRMGEARGDVAGGVHPWRICVPNERRGSRRRRQWRRPRAHVHGSCKYEGARAADLRKTLAPRPAARCLVWNQTV